MKYILLSLLLLPLLTSAQWQNLKLENRQIVFEKVYTVDSLDSIAIGKMLSASVPQVKSLSINTISQELITARFNNAYIDYKKYSNKWLNVYLNNPFTADVSIIWKDGRYRVTVINMTFVSSQWGLVTATDMLTKKRGTEITTTRILFTTGEYIDRYLTDLFSINTSIW